MNGDPCRERLLRWHGKVGDDSTKLHRRFPGGLPLDLGIAGEHLVLQAEELGLGQRH
jgi:hypothetical protein